MSCLSIRKDDHFTPTRKIRKHVRALARNHQGRGGLVFKAQRLSVALNSRLEGNEEKEKGSG